MNELIIILAVSLLLFILGIAIKHFKAYFLISGYNTLPEKVRAQVDVKALGDFSGRQLMLMSAALLTGYILKTAGFIWGMETGIGLMVIIVIYTAIRSQKFIPPHQKNKSGRFGVLISIIITTIVIAVVAWTVMPAEFNMENDKLVIEGAYGVTIEYSQVESLELRNDMPGFSVRTNGAQMGPFAKGHFKLSDGSKALVFLRSKEAPIIVIDRENAQEAVIINLKDPAATKSLYEQLNQAI